MTDRCPSVVEIVELARLPEDDPRRIHLRECPRCRAVLISYRSFMDAGAAEATPGRERARRRLAAVLAAECGEEVPVEDGLEDRNDRVVASGTDPGSRPDASSAAAARPRPATRSPRPQAQGHPWRPRPRRLPSLPRPALALAAIVLAAVALWAALAPGPEGEGPPLLRGDTGGPGLAGTTGVGGAASGGTAGTAAGAPSAWDLSAPVALSDGGLRLSWTTPEPGLEQRVEVYDVGLDVIASFGPTRASELVLPADRVGTLAAAAGPLRWRVVALREGDPVAMSPLRTLELPGR